MPLLSEAQWKTLTRLYAQGRAGLRYDSAGYGAAWEVLRQLRDHTPPLAREIVRLDPAHRTTHYLVIITDAGEQFYEKNRRMYTLFYPPQ